MFPWNYDVMVQNQRLNSEIYPTLIHLKPYKVISREDSSRQVIDGFASNHDSQRIKSWILWIMTLWIIIIDKSWNPTQPFSFVAP